VPRAARQPHLRQPISGALAGHRIQRKHRAAITPQDRPGLAQSAPGITRFRVTFTAPGTYNYICAIHDTLGMTGTVLVY
jgi:plastocyanin